ncbi:hypothetical protein [Leptolyngbya sp. FACHB-711]|nr:hypothetical protein [Leptolyngbya sp. FACHB-711]
MTLPASFYWLDRIPDSIAPIIPLQVQSICEASLTLEIGMLG